MEPLSTIPSDQAEMLPLGEMLTPWHSKGNNCLVQVTGFVGFLFSPHLHTGKKKKNGTIVMEISDYIGMMIYLGINAN